MDLCVGSMSDYLQEKSPFNSMKLEMTKSMFETTRGLVYLHENKIIHGRLSLEKVLLWMESNKPNFEPVVKITGYVYPNDNDKVF